MAGASERVEKAKKILTLRDRRMESFEQCAIDSKSRDTRCLVVLKGFNGKQGKQYFWERQRTGNTLTEENEECDYLKGCHAETYILARLDLYLEEKRSTGAESLTPSFGKMNISNNQQQIADVQQGNDVQQEKIVTIYINYSPCEKTNTEDFPNSKSCKKRIIEFLTAHENIIMNINYVNKYKSGNPKEKSDIDEGLKKQEEELIRTNRLNIRSPLEAMIHKMGRIIRER